MASCSFACSSSSSFISLVVHRLGELVADLVEALDLAERLADAFHDGAAHVLVRVELRLLRQEADADAGLRPRLAVDVRVDAGHDPQQGGFARAVETEHADLGARKERQTDVAQDDALGRHHLGDAIHGVDVLGHALICSLKNATALWSSVRDMAMPAQRWR